MTQQKKTLGYFLLIDQSRQEKFDYYPLTDVFNKIGDVNKRCMEFYLDLQSEISLTDFDKFFNESALKIMFDMKKKIKPIFRYSTAKFIF